MMHSFCITAHDNCVTRSDTKLVPQKSTRYRHRVGVISMHSYENN